MGDFRIDFGRKVPAYKQIAEEVLDRLASGAWTEGDRLPTIHEMAQMADVNPNTVVRAYRELEGRGLIEGRPGLGTFLRQPQALPESNERTEKLREICLTSLREAFLIGVGAEEFMDYMRTHFPRQQGMKSGANGP